MKKIIILTFSLFFIFQINAQLKDNDLKKLIKNATELIQKDNNSIEAYMLRAKCYYDLEYFDKAELDLKKIIKIDSENIKALMLIGDTYSKKRNFKEANYYYEEAIENGKKLDSKMKAILGTNYYFIQDYKNAIKYLTMALDDSKYKVDVVHNNLAWSYIFTNDTKMAIEHFKKAFAIKPNFVNNVNNLGYAYYLDNQLDIAEEYILKAKKMDSQNSFVYRNLGLIYKKRGNKKKACKNYEKALSLDIIKLWGAFYVEELKEYCE